MYHCDACNKNWWIFERRICIGPDVCPPPQSATCPECGAEMPNALYAEWIAGQHDDDLITSWVRG